MIITLYKLEISFPKVLILTRDELNKKF